MMDLHNLDWSHEPNAVANEIFDYAMDDGEMRAVIGFLLRRVANLEQQISNLNVRTQYSQMLD